MPKIINVSKPADNVLKMFLEESMLSLLIKRSALQIQTFEFL
jgi:hypothetical protein